MLTRLLGRLTRGTRASRDVTRTAIERRADEGLPYEPEMYELFRQTLRPGMTVVDVGAHQGLFTHLAAALVGPTGHVWAFEPAPDNFRVLGAKAAAFPQIHAVAAAVSDREGRTRLVIDEENSTRHSLFSGNVGRRSRAEPVRTVTLGGALPSDLSRLDLIKIDAQGAEPQVLDGAREVIKRHRPVVAFELWPEGWRAGKHEPADTLDGLTRLGYTLYCLSARRGLLPDSRIRQFLDERPGRWQSINVVASHPKSTARVDGMLAAD